MSSSSSPEAPSSGAFGFQIRLKVKIRSSAVRSFPLEGDPLLQANRPLGRRGIGGDLLCQAVLRFELGVGEVELVVHAEDAAPVRVAHRCIRIEGVRGGPPVDACHELSAKARFFALEGRSKLRDSGSHAPREERAGGGGERPARAEAKDVSATHRSIEELPAGCVSLRRHRFSLPHARLPRRISPSGRITFSFQGVHNAGFMSAARDRAYQTSLPTSSYSPASTIVATSVNSACFSTMSCWPNSELHRASTVASFTFQMVM